MTLKMCLFVFAMSLYIGKTLACVHRNVSCSDLQTEKGFKYSHPCPEGSDMRVENNKLIMIAYVKIGNQTGNDLDKVRNLDNKSVVTKTCEDLLMKCAVHNGHSLEDRCVDYKITEMLKHNASDLRAPPNITDGVPVGVKVRVSVGVLVTLLVLGGIIGMLCCGYMFWKGKQRGESTLSAFSRYLRTCSCLRKEIPQAEGGKARETGCPEEHRVQEVTAGDLDTTKHNGVIRMSEISAAEGSGENHLEQDDTLGIVLVHSAEPHADGKTPPSSPNGILRNKGTQPTEKCPEGRRVQEVTAGDLDTTKHNGDIGMIEISAAEGSGENHLEQDDTLRSVLVHSAEPQADGKTPPSSLCRMLRNKGIQQTENGDISAPDMNRAFNHGAMNGNLRDDPRGVNDNKGKGNVRIGELQRGRTLGDRGPEDDEENDEDQPLLSDERAANGGFDMTGGAVALVDKRGFDPDPVSRCSTTPVTGVESTPTMKTCSIQKY